MMKIASAVEAYEAASEQGPVDLEDFLSQFPEIAEDLRGLLQLEKLTQGDSDSHNQVESVSLSPNSVPAPKSLDVFGRFELIEQVGVGGMGTVFRARDPELNRQIALKRIRPEFCGDDAFAARLDKEASALAKLNHPGIVGIYEAGSVGDERFIAMEWVEGRNLSALMEDRHFSLDEILELLQSLCGALQHIHDRGLIHRDLKPSNIMIDEARDLHPMITDFGLTKDLAADHSITSQGEIVGTIGYMSPEQAVGGRGKIGFATDIYGLGTILYELLTGRPPFSQKSLESLLYAVLEEKPELPHEINDEISQGISSICMKCLAKFPEERFQTATGLRDALESHESFKSAIPLPATNSRRWFLLGGIATVAAAAVLVWNYTTDQPRSSVEYWSDQLSSANKADRANAIQNLKQLAATDESAIVALIEHCRCPDENFRKQMLANSKSSDYAFEAFQEESVAREARQEVLPALIELGDLAVPELLRACDDPNSFVFLTGLISLSSFESPKFSQEVLVAGITAMNRLPASSPERQYAQLVLGRYEYSGTIDAQQLAPNLIPALQQETDPQVIDGYLNLVRNSPTTYSAVASQIGDFLLLDTPIPDFKKRIIDVLGRMDDSGNAVLRQWATDERLDDESKEAIKNALTELQ